MATLASGVLFFVSADLLFRSIPFASFLGIVGAAIIATLFVLLFRYPPDKALPVMLANTRVQRTEAEHQLRVLTEQLASANRRLQSLLLEESGLRRSVRFERESLLARDWKSFRGDDWENYLLDIFHALGAQAQRIGSSGDQGVDLIVQLGSRRIAVQAKGYLNAVTNSAVQEAVAGKAHHRCHECVVITNSRFTKSAIELAESNRCVLIGEDDFPDFVLGNRRI